MFQSRDYVGLLTEMVHTARIVPLDGRPHLSASVRQWSGDARGQWEGDTLVIETTNFNSERGWRGSSKEMKLVGQPVSLSRTPSRLVSWPRGLGEHTDQVLKEFGFKAGEIAALRKANAI